MLSSAISIFEDDGRRLWLAWFRACVNLTSRCVTCYSMVFPKVRGHCKQRSRRRLTSSVIIRTKGQGQLTRSKAVSTVPTHLQQSTHALQTHTNRFKGGSPALYVLWPWGTWSNTVLFLIKPRERKAHLLYCGCLQKDFMYCITSLNLQFSRDSEEQKTNLFHRNKQQKAILPLENQKVFSHQFQFII